PPNTRYFAWFYDLMGTKISGPSVAFTIEADPYTITVPVLTAPTVNTTAPTPGSDPSTPSADPSDYVTGGQTLDTAGAVPFVSGTVGMLTHDPINLFWNTGTNTLK